MEWEVVGEEYGGDVFILLVFVVIGEGLSGMFEIFVFQVEVLEFWVLIEGQVCGVVFEVWVDKGCGVIVIVFV